MDPLNYSFLLLIVGHLLGGYLIGSIPFGIVMTKLFGLGNLRQIGSGNIGATNVLRTGHKLAALLTLILDAGKGAGAVWLSQYLHHHCLDHYCLSQVGVPMVGHSISPGHIIDPSHIIAYIAGFGALCGHIFPLWLRFKGGKGVATAGGTVLALDWLSGLILIAIWSSVALITRISSLAAIITVMVAPLLFYAIDKRMLALWTMLVLPFILYKHKDNISRLLHGKEPRFGPRTDKD